MNNRLCDIIDHSGDISVEDTTEASEKMPEENTTRRGRRYSIRNAKRTFGKKKDDDSKHHPRVKKVPCRSNILQAFLFKVDTLQEDLKTIPLATKRIEELCEQVTSLATSSKDETKASRDLKSVIGTTNQKAKQIQLSLSELTKETNQKYEQGELTLDEKRVCESLMVGLTNKFSDHIQKYQKAQSLFRSELKLKAKRQLQHVLAKDGDLSQAQLDEIMSSSNGEEDREAVFQHLILNVKGAEVHSQRNAAIRDAYDAVSRKQKRYCHD